MRALAPDREDRYPDAEAMRADLAGYLAETSPTTDSARLVEFLRPLYGDEVAAERRERALLIEQATSLLSGAIVDSAATAQGSEPTPVVPPPLAPLALPPPSTGARVGGDPRIGTTLGGRYYIRRLCGEGAMGRVYEAQHIDIGRRMAIKVLHSSFHTSADLVERFRREARAASKIGHANIVDVTDSGATIDGAFYFVMEYLDGTNLEELIDGTGPLPVERALLIAAQIARALEAAHAADVIHRDLKPANIMLVNRKGEDDFVKVLDFGISKDLELTTESGERRAALTRPDVAIGTPVYMAPEQAAGKPANPLTDVYAAGGLLYEMLTGCPPCAGTDAMDVLHKKAHEDPVAIETLRPDLPREVAQLVMRALSRAPRDRHTSMTDLKDDLLACLGVVDRAGTAQLPLARPSVTQMVSSTAPVKGERTVRGGLVAAVGVAAMVAAGAILYTSRTSPEPVAAATVRPVTATAPSAATRPATSAPSSAVALGDPPVAPKAPMKVASDSESTPWPERDLPPSTVARKQPAARPSAVPVSPANARRAELGIRPIVGPGTAFGSAAAERRTSVAAMAASADPTRKTPAALAQPPSVATESPAGAADDILGRGQSAFDRGDYPEAVRRGREAIAAGGALGGHLLVGDAYYRLERFPDALREYQAALALDPGNASIKRRRDLAEQSSPR
jgi:tRNA A-37 threonylcarbamoyl transferase component Bud32